MPTTFELPEGVKATKATAMNLADQAAELAGGEHTIGDILETKVRDAYKDNEDIINKLDTAQAGYLSAPAESREKYLTPTSDAYQPNPFAADRLIQQATGNALIPYLTYSGIYGQRVGRIADLINAGTNAYKGVSAQAQAKAANALQAYQSAVDEYQMLENLRQQERQLDLREQEINKPSGSGGVESGILADLLNQGLLSATGKAGPNYEITEPKPKVDMSRKDPKIHWRSPGGQWVYDFKTNDWVPDMSALFTQ